MAIKGCLFIKIHKTTKTVGHCCFHYSDVFSADTWCYCNGLYSLCAVFTNIVFCLYLCPKLIFLNAPGKLLDLTRNISGQPQQFPLTVRIFHAVLALSMAALAYNVPLNIFVGLPDIAIASGVTLSLVAFVFYLSRYREQTALARLMFCLTGTGLFIANYFLNSGINGPTGYFFILMMVVMVAVVPVKEYWYWVGSNIIIILSLHYIEYTRPETVPFTYPARADRFVDISSAYVTVIVVILACFYIIRKRYDTERREAQQNEARLRELDAEKNKLFSIIAHDLRSPLAHIQNYLELLNDDISEKERQMFRDQLLSSTRTTLDMVNNVLNWSKSQMSGDEMEFKKLNVATLLEPEVELFQRIAAQKHIELVSAIRTNATVWGSANAVQLIVRNLVNNSIKFTAAGGLIRITAGLSEGKCLLTVKDTGSGKPAELNQDIFLLSSVHTTGTANERGVGLGLSLCREYTIAMGGKIWFTCDARSGTTFFLELPAVECAVTS
ncbi:MAG: HAMP domain-containing histidine kinase [Sphingobacteriaceae bacterium]|nr:MAG: HAMP domain-containing histidine kinase [Sphingobacteriaceae bacterium]